MPNEILVWIVRVSHNPINIFGEAMTLVDFNSWEFDYDGWTMGEDALYMELLDRSQRTGDMRPLFPHWCRMIRHWPYALDPTDLANYVKLDENNCREIVEQINLLMKLPKREDGRNGGAET